VVTNDQGRYLVDTAFFKATAVPAVEVTGGCFCCNYDDLDAQLAQLRAAAQPDVIFAESVGSCADIVATVVKPLLALKPAGGGQPASFTVFADARLLRRRLLDQPMPFSDDVVYLFDKQIEEAGMLVINKRDLLTQRESAETMVLARERYPDKTVRLQNSLDQEDVEGWVAALVNGLTVPPEASLEIDYARYGAGEANLAWLDERLSCDVAAGRGRAVVLHFIAGVVARLQERAMPIGHLKLLVRGGGVEAKVSFSTLAVEGWRDAVPPLGGTRVEVLVNARVEAAAAELRSLVEDAAAATAAATGAVCEASDVAAFHPSFPKPTRRLP
jgi:Ni2+-binding GTPase involved in maturation of urease and hydrogenase